MTNQEIPESDIRDVPGYNGAYKVTRDGRVLSYYIPGNPTQTRGEFIELRQQLKCPGETYRCVTLRGRKVSVHRVVLLSFVGPPPTGRHQIGHLNGIPYDNRLENLAWVTAKENQAHRKVHGTAPIGEKNPFSKLNNRQVLEVLCMAKRGVKGTEIARTFCVTKGTIYNILNGTTWSHLRDKKSSPTTPRCSKNPKPPTIEG